MAQPQPSASRGWIVTFTGFGINLILGVLYAWGVMKKALLAQGWNNTQAALPFTASTIAFSITMIFAGRMQDKIGPKKIAVLGGCILGLGLIASAWAKSPLMMVTTFGVIGGIGIGLGYSATTPPALKWFPPAKKGLIAGIVVAGVGLAAVVMAPLTQMLLAKTSIPSTFMILGAGTIVIVSLLAMLLTNPPAGYVPAGAAPAKAAAKPAPQARRDVDWAEMITTGAFWKLWLILALSASAGLMIIAHISTIVLDQASLKQGFQFVMLVAVFNTLGRLIGGSCSDKIGRTNTMILFFSLQAVNMLAFSHYTTAPMLIFGAAFTGICYGTIFPLFPAATADYYGIKNLGVNYGCLFTAFGVAGTLGPILGGKFRDMTGNYTGSYIACAVMLLVSVALALMTKAPKLEAAPAAAPAARQPEREMAKR